MTDTKQPIDKRILGDQRIFQAVFNDLKMKHELVELTDGTHRYVYTYEGIDPYELEDSAFPSTVQLIHQYGDTRAIKELNGVLHDDTPGGVWVKDKVVARLAELKKTKEESNDS